MVNEAEYVSYFQLEYEDCLFHFHVKLTAVS